MRIDRQFTAAHSELAAACERWRQLPAIVIDTEFVRERPFYPGLGLIQVSDGATSTLVDAVAIRDLEPLREVLEDPAVTKIFHSCGEDLEVLYHRFGAFPEGVFDTQIAATLSGLGTAPGYGKLVSALFDVELPKDKTRTNWLRRPLSDAQLTYAALDVAYLVPAHERLGRRLRRLGRESWMREELESLFDAERFLPDPERAYLRVRAWRSLAPRQLAALRDLATWRERQARRRDLPRNFVLKERAMVDVARRRPKTLGALAAIGSLHPKEIERHGKALLRILESSGRLAPDALPRAAPRTIDLTRYRGHVRRLRDAVAAAAAALSLPPELLATRRTIETLVRRVIAGKTPRLPRELRGWRRAEIGEPLLELLEELSDPLPGS